MNYQKYDEIQAELGAVSGYFLSDMKKILEDSSADPATKALVKETSDAVASALNNLAILAPTKSNPRRGIFLQRLPRACPIQPPHAKASSR